MNIKWLGHASFLITTSDKKRILTDPYNTGHGISYKPINESADIVTMSHEHGDHNNAGAVKGNPVVLSKAGSQTVKSIDFKAIAAFHDESQGSQRGNDLIFCFKVDGLNLCHLGDLGHPLSPQQIKEIGNVDILFIPVGGFFTIDSKGATAISQALKPKVIFPMHYKNAKVEFPIAGVDDFLKDKKNVRRLNTSETEIIKETLPKETEIVVLQSAN
jgi:L-ascorbate metabolism protein UlaG (beta-lactamase superfamily)